MKYEILWDTLEKTTPSSKESLSEIFTLYDIGMIILTIVSLIIICAFLDISKDKKLVLSGLIIIAIPALAICTKDYGNEPIKISVDYKIKGENKTLNYETYLDEKKIYNQFKNVDELKHFIEKEIATEYEHKNDKEELKEFLN